jgi:hypothetical protein
MLSRYGSVYSRCPVRSSLPIARCPHLAAYSAASRLIPISTRIRSVRAASGFIIAMYRPRVSMPNRRITSCFAASALAVSAASLIGFSPQLACFPDDSVLDADVYHQGNDRDDGEQGRERDEPFSLLRADLHFAALRSVSSYGT